MSHMDRSKIINRRSMDLGALCRNCHKRIIKRNLPLARFRTVLDDVNEKGFCSTQCQETYYQNRVKVQSQGFNRKSIFLNSTKLKGSSDRLQPDRSSGNSKGMSGRHAPVKRNIPAPPPPVSKGSVSKVEFKREIDRVVTRIKREHEENRKKLLSGFKDILLDVTRTQKNEMEQIRKQNDAIKLKNEELTTKIIELKNTVTTELGKMNSKLEKIENTYNHKLKGKESELHNIKSSYEEYQVKILNSFKNLLD